MTFALPLLVCLFWVGPAAALLLVSLILEQRRHAPNGTRPRENILLRSLVGGIIAAIAWFVLITAVSVVSGRDAASLWIVATPWAFALGQGLGLAWKRALPLSD